MEQENKLPNLHDIDSWREWYEAEKKRVMEVGKFIKELGKEGEWIEDAECYAEAVAEIIDEYCEKLGKEEGMSIPVDQWEDAVNERWTHVWSDKAQRIIEAEIKKWEILGLQYWPDGDIDIQQHLIQYREL